MATNRLHGYDVIFEETPSGYSCHAPGLPGCVSAGDTLTECKRHMKAAIELHLEGMREDGQQPPPRDGRAAPRPGRTRGRQASIPSRISPEAAQALAAVSKAKGLSKTEALELCIRKYNRILQGARRSHAKS